MDKTADTNMPLLDVIRNRWSPRSFAERPVTREQMEKILEAARWAPSAANGQPWRFVVCLKGEPEFQLLWQCLAEGNQPWTANAAVLVALCTRSVRDSGKPNTHGWYDAGQAAASLSLQALADGVYVHQMAGFSADAVRSAFDIPADFEAVTVLALGYRGEAEDLPQPYQEWEGSSRERKQLDAICGFGAWPAGSD